MIVEDLVGCRQAFAATAGRTFVDLLEPGHQTVDVATVAAVVAPRVETTHWQMTKRAEEYVFETARTIVGAGRQKFAARRTDETVVENLHK